MNEEPLTPSRRDTARQAAEQLLDSLESGSDSSEQILMKAKRLARLLRDTHATQWLDYELRGYPGDLKPETLSSNTFKLFLSSGRLRHGGRIVYKGLPEIEMGLVTRKEILEKLSPSQTVSRFDEFADKVDRATMLQAEIPNQQMMVSSIKGAIHNYATDTLISLTFGERVEAIFESARNKTDEFVARRCPKVAEQLLSIEERLQNGDSEACSQALMTCRRMLLAVADAVFPAQSEPYLDSTGTKRTVGPDEYKNRLLAFVTDRVKGKSNTALVVSELEHLSARLDAVNDKASKGVHTDVSADEARLTVIHTYMFIAEVAQADGLNSTDNPTLGEATAEKPKID